MSSLYSHIFISDQLRLLLIAKTNLSRKLLEALLRKFSMKKHLPYALISNLTFPERCINLMLAQTMQFVKHYEYSEYRLF